MPVTTALSSRLNVTIVAGSTDYMDCAQSAMSISSESLTGRGEGIVEFTGCELLRLDDDLLFDLLELFEGVTDNTSILNIKKSRLGPVAVGCERNFADHRIEGVCVNITADRVWIQTLRRRHCLFENFHAGIGVRRQVKAQEIGADYFRLLLVDLEKLLDAGKIRGRRGHVEFIAQHIVHHWTKLLLQLCILQADHSAAEYARLQFLLVRSTNDPGGIRWIGSNKDNFRVSCLDRADDRSEFHLVGWIATVVNDLQTVFLRIFARSQDHVTGELGERADYRDGHRLGFHCHRSLEKTFRCRSASSGPVRQHLEVFVIIVFFVHRDSAGADKHLLTLHDDGEGGGLHGGAVAPEHQVDLIDVEQLAVDAGDQCGVGLIVVIDELDGPAKQPPSAIDVVTPHLDCEQRRFSISAKWTRLRHAESNLDRLCGKRRTYRHRP